LVGGGIQSPILNRGNERVVVAAYELAQKSLNLRLQLGYGTERYRINSFEGRSQRARLTGRAIRYWDWNALSIGLGALVGGQVWRQTFSTIGIAPTRHTLAFLSGVHGLMRVRWRRLFLSLETEYLSFIMKSENQEKRWATPFAFQLGLLAGFWW
jgi:hypothetical protein